MGSHAVNGRIGALESWGNTVDRTARTKPAHSRSPASLDYWLAKVDPEGAMTSETRLKAAKAKHRAHMLRLAKASAAARRKRSTRSAA